MRLNHTIMPSFHWSKGEQFWKKVDFGLKFCSRIEMQFRKRKNSLIKSDITGYVNATGGYIKTFKPLVPVIIAKKNTLFRSELKLTLIVWS
jgi:hypothetical protein